MVKTTIVRDVECKYPCLKISDIGQIVLFTDKCQGILLCKGESTCNVGEYVYGWIESNFKEFCGTITIENQ